MGISSYKAGSYASCTARNASGFAVLPGLQPIVACRPAAAASFLGLARYGGRERNSVTTVGRCWRRSQLASPLFGADIPVGYYQYVSRH